MAADTQETRTLPIPDDFPVDWRSPDEQKLSFMWSQDHFPSPITPLDFAFFRDVGEFSVGRVCEHYEAPITGWHIRRFGTYMYQANMPFRGSEEELEARTRRSEEKTLADMRRLGERWSDELLPEIREHIAFWDGFDLEGASTEELLEHFDETWRRGLRAWEIHFLTIVPAYIALSEYEELYRQLFPDAQTLEPWKALGGQANKTTEVAEGTWRLSRIVAGSPDVRAALDADEPIAALEDSDDGRSFLAELDAFLEAYGKRNDTWVLSAPAWIEDPSLVLKNVRDLAERADDDAPAITTKQAERERESAVTAMRERLKGYPAPVRDQFEILMRAAREATVIQDDHNFWIDFCCAYRMRRVMLEVGRRMADAGVLDARDDVFLLEPDELRETMRSLPDLDRRELAAERREAMNEFADYDPPRHLGTERVGMRAENPVTRFMTKFYGIPPAPSDRPDLITGLPGSSGRARGVARVIKHVSEMDRLGEGEILVAPTTAPPWTPVFATAGAVVTDSGGVLCHAAVVAREYGIPAVVGTALATQAIADGALVEVDGAAGEVRILDAVEPADPVVDEAPTVPAGRFARNGGTPDAGPEEALEDVPSFVEQVQLRNEDIISEAEQGLVNTLRVLVAGCGSVGGSAVEPLVRLGVGELILADPDAYDLNNINRQAATVADVGRPKVEVHAERARAINPFVKVTTLGDGLTPRNVEKAVLASTIVFDGIDPSPGPLYVKYLLHKYAARHRVPVLTGADLGGQPTVWVYDYRRDSRPFYGKANVEAFREGRLFEALVPVIGLRNVPSDFLPVVLERAGQTPDPDGPKRLMDRLGWPQISYCTQALGALTTRTIVDVAQGREVPHLVTVDLHMLTRTPAERRSARMRRPLVLAKTVQTVRRAMRDGGPAEPAKKAADPLAAVPEALLPVIDAVRRSPSAHNTQPWIVAVEDERTLRLEHDPLRRLDVADRDGRFLCMGMGCAIEAASRVADLEWQPGEITDPLDPEWTAGTLSIAGVRADEYRQAAGLLAARGTNRAPYSSHRVEPGLLKRIETIGARHGVQAYTLDSTLGIRNYAKFAAKAAMAPFTHGPYLDELLDWIRFSERERDYDADGFTPETLGLSPSARRTLRALKMNPKLRSRAVRVNLPALLGYLSTGTVKQSAALVMIATRSSSPRAWTDAGRAMMAIWLEATRANLAVQPVTFGLDEEQLRPVVGTLFGASLSDVPVMVMRIGRPTMATPSARRLPLERIVRA
ncbi:MAG TPA: ThiF family adenylyltransferase [Solirubrobacteraceae bacterium]